MRKFGLYATTAVALIASVTAGVQTAAAQAAPQTPPGAGEQSSGAVQPFWRDIRPFYGHISPFWRDIRPFWGDVAPFWGSNSPFTGDSSGFWGESAQGGSNSTNPSWDGVAPFWRNISPFMGDLEALWRDIRPFEDDATGYAELRSRFQDLVDQSAMFWGPSVQGETGKSFWDGFAADVFNKYGIALDDPSTFSGFSDADRAQFMFDWYDGLMAFSGRDHVDHWMKTANWTPKVTQEKGGGAGTIIGLIDFALTPDGDLQDNSSFILWSGNEDPYQGHGGAVASLMVADHDGHGVMGIAPNASVAAFNPFDSSGYASWDMVRSGIRQVSLAGANVVNMSLGIPGSTLDQGWANVYSDPVIALLSSHTIFVHAAGNEGVAQTANINWNFLTDPNMVIVGSVGPSETISSFSNTPGYACLLSNGVCDPKNMLMNRFLVAPGEWILVTDGEGGVRRASGTSFAAPIVTGAIALMHDRWGWLAQHPSETLDVIYQTAKDLGAPGVDPVYGRGLIDIAASQQPIDPSKLYLLTPNDGSPLKQPLTTVNNAETLVWGAVDGVVTVYEDIGSTYRDFRIPLSSILTNTVAPTTNTVQTYVETAVSPLVKSVGGLLSKTKKKLGGLFLEGEQVANPFGWELTMDLAELPFDATRSSEDLAYATEFTVTSSDNVTMRFGNGFGAQSIDRRAGALSGSFDPYTGGANPVLGLASGGVFGKFEVPVGESARLDVGVTQRTFESRYRDPFSGEVRALYEDATPYQAMAANMTLVQDLSEGLSLSVGYTFLQERDGLLGTVSSNPAMFKGGAQTDAANVALEWSLSDRIMLSGGATLARTRGQSGGDQMLTVGRDGIVSSAFEAALTMDSVFGANDSMRLALVQPMHVESGAFDLSTYDIIDRQTGEMGMVGGHTGVDGQARELAVEFIYATPIMNGDATIAGFARAEAAMADGVRDGVDHIWGGQFRMGF